MDATSPSDRPGRGRFLAFAALLLLSCLPARAAAGGGALVVHVAQEPWPDRPSGPADFLPGATVRLSTDSSFGAGRYGLRQSFANRRGVAVLTGLPPDGYWMEVGLEGFETRSWFVDLHSGFTRHVEVELGLIIPECTLGRFWDFRETLDPSMPQSTYIYRMETAPP